MLSSVPGTETAVLVDSSPWGPWMAGLTPPPAGTTRGAPCSGQVPAAAAGHWRQEGLAQRGPDWWRDPAPPWLAPPHPLKCRHPWRTGGAFLPRGEAVRGRGRWDHSDSQLFLLVRQARWWEVTPSSPHQP